MWQLNNNLLMGATHTQLQQSMPQCYQASLLQPGRPCNITPQIRNYSPINGIKAGPLLVKLPPSCNSVLPTLLLPSPSTHSPNSSKVLIPLLP